MPLGAARLNTLSLKTTHPAIAGSGTTVEARISQSMVIEEFGDTKISTTQNKFGGASIAMDGTGDYIQIADVGNNLDFGTGDFTIEWFNYLTSLDRFAVDLRNGSNGAKILLYSYPSDGSADDLYLYVNSANRITASNVLSANQWQHIALVRESGTTSLYVDGTQVGSTYSDSNNYSHDQIQIWHNSIGAENYTPPGFVDEFRISKGFARYSGASITVPTSAFTSDVNTHLLIHGDGDNNSTVILDDGVRTDAPVSVTLSDNAHLSTDQTKFGSTSCELDGTDDAIDPDHGSLNIGAGDFTIEFFYYPTDLSTVHGRYFFDTGSGTSGRLNGYFNSSSEFVIRNGNTELLKASHGMSTGQWYHLALVRKDGTLKFYRDGTELASTSNSTNFSNNDYRIGSYLTGGGFGIVGYVDEFRDSNVARYSQAFTPSTSAFEPDGYTRLLLHFDGTNGATTTTDDRPTHPLDWLDTNDSYYLNGTVSSNSTSSVDLTVSFWFRHISGMASDSAPILMYAADDSISNFTGIEYQGGRIRVVTQSGGVLNDFLIGTYSASFGSGTYDDGQWHHFVFSRDGSASAKHAYVDGNSVTINVNVGRDNGSANMWLGSSMTKISIMSGHGFTGDTRVADIHIAQFFVDNVFHDITNTSTREKFYKNGLVDMGTDGTKSGLDQPLIFHTGNSSQFETRGGDITSFPYTMTQNGTGIDGAPSDGPE